LGEHESGPTKGMFGGGGTKNKKSKGEKGDGRHRRQGEPAGSNRKVEGVKQM